MTASMTGFCRTQIDLDGCSLIWEVRSVNHRYLDAHLKLPEELRIIETGARSLINGRLNRGRIDAALKYEARRGENLDIDISESALDALANALKTYEMTTPTGARPMRLSGIKQRWQKRLEELGDEIEPARLAQELAILLTRSDVSEELDRLETHFDEVDRILKQSKPAGRRLDFLMQELNREANTLGSKSVDLRNTNSSVELKVLIDQMREQVQNIE